MTGHGLKTQGSGLKRVTLACVAVLAVLATCLASLHAADPLPPELTQPVNDFAHVIDAQSASSMDQQIRALKAASGDVVVVATIDTFAPYADIREYAVKMFENRGHGIGDKGKDNGLLVLLAVKDRKVWVEVGYDLEQYVTDGYAGDVSRTAMAPAFARSDYGGGLFAGVSQLIGRIAQARGITLNGVPVPAPARTGRGGFPLSPGLIFFLFILFTIVSRMFRGSRMVRGGRRWGGSGWSGWNSGVGPFGGGGGFGGGFGGFGGGSSGGGGGGASW